MFLSADVSRAEKEEALGGIVGKYDDSKEMDPIVPTLFSLYKQYYISHWVMDVDVILFWEKAKNFDFPPALVSSIVTPWRHTVFVVCMKKPQGHHQ